MTVVGSTLKLLADAENGESGAMLSFEALTSGIYFGTFFGVV